MDPSYGCLKCGICKSFFDANHIPRTLKCKHSFCTLCLQQSLVRSQGCHLCGACIVPPDLNFIPINQVLMNYCLSFVSRFHSSPISSSSNNVEIDNSHEVQFEGICSRHSYRREYVCMTCLVRACRLCKVMKHYNCMCLLIDESVEEIGKVITQYLEEIIVIERRITELIYKYEKHINETELEVKHNIEQIVQLEKLGESLELKERKKNASELTDVNVACNYSDQKFLVHSKKDLYLLYSYFQMIIGDINKESFLTNLLSNLREISDKYMELEYLKRNIKRLHEKLSVCQARFTITKEYLQNLHIQNQETNNSEEN